MRQLEQAPGQPRRRERSCLTSVPRIVPNRGKVPSNVQMLQCGSTSGGSSHEATVTNALGHDATHNVAVLLAWTAVADPPARPPYR
jgi:hypothetical protein